jgi:hypothetical protein
MNMRSLLLAGVALRMGACVAPPAAAPTPTAAPPATRAPIAPPSPSRSLSLPLGVSVVWSHEGQKPE